MSKLIDETGNRYGKLLVIKRGENSKHGKAQWWCQCDCGSELKLIAASALRQGLTISCGCNKLEKLKKYNEEKIVNEVGNKYGKLLVISRNDNSELQKDGRAMWNCKCDCGNICVVSGKSLRNGHTSSCGCGIKSKGECYIEELLIKNNIDYYHQYSVYIEQNIYKVKQNHPYYFDFAVFKNNKIEYLIEYDGEQHFLAKESSSIPWNTPKQVELTKKRDAIKNKWCKENNIPLIRIPYTHLKKICIEDLLLETSSFIL